jgi:hypothetical protein
MSDKLISQKTSTELLLALTAVVVVTFSLLPQIPQPQSYHLFADRRGFVGIPNFGDVVPNVPFGVIGICELPFLLCSSPGQSKERFLDPRERWPYVLVFHWLAPDSIRFVLLSPVSEQCATGLGSTANDDRIHGDGSCNHLGAD